MQTSTTKSVYAACLLSLLFALPGCGPPPEFPANYRIFDEEPNDSPEALTREAVLVADNQQQYLYGKPVWIRTPLADRFVGTAIRAPQLDLFGPSVLEWVLDNNTDQTPTIHLGDGLNLSCEAEYNAFIGIMNHANGGWFMAPGNHDGIYFGSSDSSSEWRAVCDGDRPISQANFVERYVSEVLAGQPPAAGQTRPKPSPDVGAQRFAREFGNRRKKGSWQFPGADAVCARAGQGAGACPLLTRIAWNVDDLAPHHSYVVQELTMTQPGRTRPVKYVLLDTSNYEHAPALVPVPPRVNAGTTGDVTEQQLKVVEGWFKPNGSAKPADAPIVVLLGHHPFDALTARAQAGLERLRSRLGVLLYVSAHTHHGDYFVNGPDRSSWMELNVGSTVDWPLEYRTLRLVKSAQHGLYSNSTLFEVRADLEDEAGPRCDPKWQPQRENADYSVLYNKDLSLDAAQTRTFIFNSLLSSYRRLLEALPSSTDNTVWPQGTQVASDTGLLQLIVATTALDGSTAAGASAKRSLLLALDGFDTKRRLQVPADSTPDAVQTLRRDYRLCQAIWASQDDQHGVRKARRENWYISYPGQKE